MFKILSLDGGGIRGAFIAAFLAKLQENLQQPLAAYFDLITGTSTGGLIAVALGMGIAPEEIKNLYEREGARIFTRSVPQLSAFKRGVVNFCLRLSPIEVDVEWWYRAKYSGEALREVLTDKLGGRRLEEAQTRLAIPSVDLTAAKTVVFKTPHRPNFVRDRHFRAVDVILATTAAPSYFPTASIEQGSAYCDGGLWANNPSLVGYVEAIKICQECNRPGIDEPFNQNAVHLLSIGTGEASYFLQPTAQDSGLKWWAPRLLNVSGEAQSEGIHWQMRYLLGTRYERVNFDISTGNWALDSVDNISALVHKGAEQAVQRIGDLRTAFFRNTAPRYVPFAV